MQARSKPQAVTNAQIIAYPIRDNLYLSITDRCTLECEFCPKTQGNMLVQGFDLSVEKRPGAKSIINSIGDAADYREIVFCGYGEPTLRLKTLLEVAGWIKDHGGRIRINTDGLANLVHKRNVLPEMQGLVDSLSVSLNAQNEEVYNRHCRPQLADSYQAMLDFLQEAPKYIADVTATAIDGLAGVDIKQCEILAKQLGVKFKKRVLDVVG